MHSQSHPPWFDLENNIWRVPLMEAKHVIFLIPLSGQCHSEVHSSHQTFSNILECCKVLNGYETQSSTPQPHQMLHHRCWKTRGTSGQRDSWNRTKILVHCRASSCAGLGWRWKFQCSHTEPTITLFSTLNRLSFYRERCLKPVWLMNPLKSQSESRYETVSQCLGVEPRLGLMTRR